MAKLDNEMRNMNLNALSQNDVVEIVEDSVNNTLLDEQLNQNESFDNNNQVGVEYYSDEEQVVQFVSVF
jgi:hypothetical protein